MEVPDWKKERSNSCYGDDFRMEVYKKGTYEWERERPCFISGLNQRLTEICLDGNKLFSMGNMWPSKWQGALRSREPPSLLARGTVWSATKSAWYLLLFLLQMALRRVKGQSDNHICKHTSPPEQYFWRTSPAWPFCFWQVNVCNALTYRSRCVSRALDSAMFVWSSLSNKEKLRQK